MIISCFFCNCGQETTTLSEVTDLNELEAQTPTHQLDTTIVYCFQTGGAGIEERIEIYVKGNRVKGTGLRVYAETQETYQLNIDGLINKNLAEVNVSAGNVADSKKSYKKIESWIWEKDGLIVENRDIEMAKGQVKFYRINCANLEKKDSVAYYDSFGGFYEGYAVVSKNGYYGLINEKGGLTIPLKYRDLGIVNEGSIVYYDENSGLRGLLDVNGNIIVPAKYGEIHCYNEGLAAFLTDEGKWGFMDKNQKVVIEPIYTNINFFKPNPARHPFNEGLANVQFQNGYWNFINTKGETVIAGNFMFTKSFQNGKAEVFKDNKWFTIDKTGKCIENCD